MTLASRLHLPTAALAAPAPAGQRLRQNIRTATAVWLAFMVGIVGADLWMARSHTLPLPETQIEVGPVPLPLVAGVDPVDQALPPAPMDGLEESLTEGKLPVMAPDGRSPLTAYAYPFDRTDRHPRISIILTGAGAQQNLLSTALRRLPGSVAVSFAIQTPGIGAIMAATRAAGHEMLVTIPADSATPQVYDPGPGALRSTLPVSENLQRLYILMGKASGYIGFLIDPATTLLSRSDLAHALLDEGQKRGLGLFSTNPDFTQLGLEQNSPTALITQDMADRLAPSEIDRALADTEQRARETGHAILMAPLYPVTISHLSTWLPTLAEKGLVLAPPSAALTPPSAPPPSATTPLAAHEQAHAPAH